MPTLQKRIEALKQRALVLRREVYTLYLSYRDPRVPWYAKVFAGAVVAYAFSPVDLIPDFVPVLGYLDDLVLIPLGTSLAIKMIPAEVLKEYRQRAKEMLESGEPTNWWVAAVIIALWVAIAAAIIYKIFSVLAK